MRAGQAKTQTREHIPVLVDEVMSHFDPQPGDMLLDTTFGLGGHAEAYLERAGQGSAVVGLDADTNALAKAKQHIEGVMLQRITLIHSNFANLEHALAESGLSSHRFTHILFDLGIGSHQLGDEARGFSFKGEGSLSMLYSSDVVLPAADSASLNILEARLGRYPDVQDIIRGVSIDELSQLIRAYGEERHARRIAAGIKRSVEMVNTPQDLARIIAESAPSNYEHGRIHPATRTFQALRLAVNRELESLRTALPQAVGVVESGGMIGIISFHSLEDRIVKRYFRQESRDCICPPEQPVCQCSHKASLSVVTKKPITASAEEINRNPRARSAKLRIATKK